MEDTEQVHLAARSCLSSVPMDGRATRIEEKILSSYPRCYCNMI